MTNKNREIFFLIENSDGAYGKKFWEKSRSGEMALNLINKFSISEADQYEISGLHSYTNKLTTKKAKGAKRQRFEELISEREKIFKNFSNASGTLNLFICGMNVFKDFDVSTIKN